ncbi:translocation protein Sec62-domain-containing protein [Chytriomyces sp. MP71]|nr:translocation protein Sec62-domain-containing protein [Chytriomyces sp. MP71]
MRSTESKLKVRQGIFNGHRVDFFKGKHAVNSLLREPYRKDSKRPEIADRDAAEQFAADLQKNGFFLRVEKQPKNKTLTLQPVQVFSPDAYYIWVYDNAPWWSNLAGVGVLVVIFLGVLFPLWPAFMRQGVYYLSLAFLGLMGLFFALAVFRLILWIGLKVVTGRGGWLFPNLFADCGVIESFIPTWGWDEVKGSKSAKSKQSDDEGGDEGADDGDDD